MRALAIPASICALAGCDKLLGLGTVSAPPGDSAPLADSTIDGGPVRCPTMTPRVFYCADYDEVTPEKFIEGTPTGLAPAPTGALVTARPPAISAPNGLWVETTNDAYEDEVTGTTTVSHLHASFWLQIEHASSYAFETVMIGIAGNDPHACQAFTQISSGTPALRLMTICGGDRMFATAFPAIPTGWVSVDLDLDLAGATASMSVNHQQPGTIDLRSYQPITGLADVRAGVLYNQGNDGGKVAIDDLVVTTAP